MNGEKIIRLKTSRDKRLDDLALRLADLMDEESIEDSMLVCASLIGFVISEMPLPLRKKRMSLVFEFIQSIAERPK